MPLGFLPTRNAVVFVVVMVAGTALLWVGGVPKPPDQKRHTIPARADKPDGRPVYPFSVVPGGVYSGKEVRDATKKDPTVDKHYAEQGIDTNDLDAVKLKQGRKGYVSYRFGDHIYWTKKKVEISPGEVVVTDGNKRIRARCGNMISDKPRSPVLPVEPSEKELNTPSHVPPPQPGTASAGPDFPLWPPRPPRPTSRQAFDPNPSTSEVPEPRTYLPVGAALLIMSKMIKRS